MGTGHSRTQACSIQQRRLDEWVCAFADRLVWFGATESQADLARLALALHAQYDLLDPYDVARLVWRRGKLAAAATNAVTTAATNAATTAAR